VIEMHLWIWLLSMLGVWICGVAVGVGLGKQRGPWRR
jgi:hypothetical protein